MASIFLKRPSSARRNITQKTFSPFVSSTRLRRVQSLTETEQSGASCPDAILCILGIDSRYNEGTRELVNYLLFDFFDIRRTELARSGIPDETIDDMIFLIGRSSVDIYCNPINYCYLLPYVAHWRNLHIHCLSEKDYEDSEKAEEFKIQSFVNVVRGFHKIGIPFSSRGQNVEFDKMVVEKWPLIQAFAIEDLGGGGFFTMKHEVVDVGPEVQGLYHFLDPVSVESLITQQLPLFDRQMNSTLALFDEARSENRSGLTNVSACEPLKTYYNHGRVINVRDKAGGSCRKPYVLFGKNTSRKYLESMVEGGAICCSDLDSAGIAGKPALHMMCQAISPRTALGCTRTYFFRNGVTPLTFDKKSASGDLPGSGADVRQLIQIYAACVQSVLEAIRIYSETLSPAQAELAAKDVLRIQTKQLPNQKHLTQSINIDFKLEAYDNNNRSLALKEGVGSLLSKSACITVYDIPSLEHTGECLGSVSFAETFLDSTLRVRQPGEKEVLDAEVIILTCHIPRFITWPSSDEERQCYATIENQAKVGESTSYGKSLLPGEAVVIATEDARTEVRKGKLYIHEQAITVLHPRLGAVVLPKTDLKTIHFYDGDSTSVVALLVLTYKESLQEYIPYFLRSANNCLVLGFYPKSKSYKAFFSEVLPLWNRKDEEPELQMLDELPSTLQWLHAQLQDEYKISGNQLNTNGYLKQSATKLPGVNRFMDHFAAASVGRMPVSQRHLAPVTNLPWDEGSFEDQDQLLVTIVGGVPGSHKEALGQNVTRRYKQNCDWATVQQSLDSSEPFTAHHLQDCLAKTWRAPSKSRHGGFASKKRVLVITPGFTDTVEVVQAIVSHPDKDVAAHIKIGAVTVCVDPQNVFMTDMYSLPNLLNQCAEGWVNNIVFTSTANNKCSLDVIQQLLRSVNSDVAFLLADNGDITRSTDLDLILSDSSFNEEALLRARYLSCPGWWLGRYNVAPSQPRMQDLKLRFSQPLEKPRFLTRLKSLRSAHTKHPFDRNIYYVRGRIQFFDCADVYKLDYCVLSGYMSITPTTNEPTNPTAQSDGSTQPPSFYLVFTGCSLQDAKLRDWLRGCARQKPEKKMLRSRENITQTEIKRIHKEHHLDALPEGWFYNGSRFVSMAGDKCDTHPNIEKFINQYLDNVNQEVLSHNARVQREEYHDLFE